MLGESGNANWIEVIWTLEGFLGIALSLIAFWDGYEDRKVIKEMDMNHGLEIIARTNLQTEIFRMVPHCFVVSIGLIAMTYSPSPYPQGNLAWAVTIMLFSIPLCAACNTVNSLFTRRKLIKLNAKAL